MENNIKVNATETTETAFNPQDYIPKGWQKGITEKLFFAAFIAGEYDLVFNGQSMQNKAQEMLEAIESRNQKNRDNPNKKKTTVDNTETKHQILEFLLDKNESLTAKTIAEAIGATIQKTTGVLRQMIKAGEIQRIELSRNQPLEYRKA